MTQLWNKQPNEVTDEEYYSLYKSISNDHNNPLSVTYFAVEGKLKAVLFVPNRAPSGLFETGYKKNNIKIYVNGTFITDEVDETIPDWLRFVYGVIRLDDHEIDSSNEIIKKYIIKKTLDMLETISKTEQDYEKFYHNFNRCIKLGVYTDPISKERLSKLLRYTTSKSKNKLISLSQYIINMKTEQKDIYFITGDNSKQSPFLEQYIKKDYEVLFMDEPIDEYCISQIDIFADIPLVNITYDNNLNIGCDSGFSQLCAVMQTHLNDRVERVIVSNRLVDSPCMISTSQCGWSSYMEKIMKFQIMRDKNMDIHLIGKKTLEINPDHKVIQQLRDKVESSSVNNDVRIELLYQTARIVSGYEVDSPSMFAKHIHHILEKNID